MAGFVLQVLEKIANSFELLGQEEGTEVARMQDDSHRNRGKQEAKEEAASAIPFFFLQPCSLPVMLPLMMRSDRELGGKSRNVVCKALAWALQSRERKDMFKVMGQLFRPLFDSLSYNFLITLSR